MATQVASTTDLVTTKSGKGNASGVVSELSTFWTVKPGHEGELRAAIQRFIAHVRSLPPETNMRTGLRDVRFVVFDNGQRMLFATGFETDWDSYIDDVVLTVGMPYFIGWLQHLEEGNRAIAWAEKAGVTTIASGDPKLDEIMKRAGGEFKAIVQDQQVPAETYDNFLGAYTMPEVAKADRVNQAFQQVLDDPAAAQALQAAPALKPLLDLAAS
jgi:hypothetical protein